MPRHARVHTKTHMHTPIAPTVDSCVCSVYVYTSLCRLSATDRFIVAEQQRLVFLSLKESVFSPVEFNQFGVGGGVGVAFPGRIFPLTYTQSSISWIHTVTTELFFI